MVTHFHFAIIVLVVAHMRKFEGFSKCILCSRHSNKVYVVKHYTIDKYFKLIMFAMTLDERQIFITVSIVKKYVLLIVAPLRYMVGIAYGYHSCYACHALQYKQSNFPCQFNSSCPYFPLFLQHIIAFYLYTVDLPHILTVTYYFCLCYINCLHVVLSSCCPLL